MFCFLRLDQPGSVVIMLCFALQGSRKLEHLDKTLLFVQKLAGVGTATRRLVPVFSDSPIPIMLDKHRVTCKSRKFTSMKGHRHSHYDVDRKSPAMYLFIVGCSPEIDHLE